MKWLSLLLALIFAHVSDVHGQRFLPPVEERGASVFPADGDYVVVVHGWAWMRNTMRPTVEALHKENYHVISVSYDARNETPEEVEVRIADAVNANCTDAGRRVHFVGHSMGCLMIRKYLEGNVPVKLGEVVFMAPPNQGIEAVDKVKDVRLFRMIFGETARQLGTGEDCFPQSLGPAVGYAPGIIMGSDVSIPLLSYWLPGPDDGVVSMASGALEGMRELICVRCIHMSIPGYEKAVEQTSYFLKNGRFDSEIFERPEKQRAGVRISGRR